MTSKRAALLDPIPVDSPDWRRSRPQLWHDAWRGRDRVCRFVGACVVCGRRTYAFDDGENDPRGILGDHAASPLIASEYDRTGPDVPACFLCTNDYDRYQIAMRHAERTWSAAEDAERFRVFGDPIETPERHAAWHRVNNFPQSFYGACGPCTRSVPLP